MSSSPDGKPDGNPVPDAVGSASSVRSRASIELEPPAATAATHMTAHEHEHEHDGVEQMVSQLRQYCDQNGMPCLLLSNTSTTMTEETSLQQQQQQQQQQRHIQCCRQIRVLAQHLLAHNKPTSHSYAIAWQRSLVQALQQYGRRGEPELQKEVSAALAALAAVQSQPQQRSPNNSNHRHPHPSMAMAMSPPRMTWLSQQHQQQQQQVPVSLSSTKTSNGVLPDQNRNSSSAGIGTGTGIHEERTAERNNGDETDGNETEEDPLSNATQPAATAATTTTKPMALRLDKSVVATTRPINHDDDNDNNDNSSMTGCAVHKKVVQHRAKYVRAKYGSERRHGNGKRLFVNVPQTEQLDGEIYQAFWQGTPHKEQVKDPASGRRAIEQVCANDVILGRGNSIQSFPGNEKFRMYVHQTKPDYLCASRNRKGCIAVNLVYRVLTQTPSGRFLESIDNEFYVVDYDRAVEKTCQALREKKSQPPPNFKKWEKEQKKAINSKTKSRLRSVVNPKHDVERAKKRRQLGQLDQQKTSSPTTSTTITTTTTTTTTTASPAQQEKDQVKVSAVTMASNDEPKSAQAQRPRGQQLVKRRPLPMMLSSNVVGAKNSSDSEGIYYDYTVPEGQTPKRKYGDTRKLVATSASSPELPKVVAATVPQQLPLALSMSSPSASFFLQLRLEELRNKPPPACGAGEEALTSSPDVTARETDVAFILAKMGNIQHC